MLRQLTVRAAAFCSALQQPRPARIRVGSKTYSEPLASDHPGKQTAKNIPRGRCLQTVQGRIMRIIMKTNVHYRSTKPLYY
jgi:hypothetical protein